MLRRLVGSEMCITDRVYVVFKAPPTVSFGANCWKLQAAFPSHCFLRRMDTATGTAVPALSADGQIATRMPSAPEGEAAA